MLQSASSPSATNPRERLRAAGRELVLALEKQDDASLTELTEIGTASWRRLLCCIGPQMVRQTREQPRTDNLLRELSTKIERIDERLRTLEQKRGGISTETEHQHVAKRQAATDTVHMFTQTLPPGPYLDTAAQVPDKRREKSSKSLPTGPYLDTAAQVLDKSEKSSVSPPSDETNLDIAAQVLDKSEESSVSLPLESYLDAAARDVIPQAPDTKPSEPSLDQGVETS